MKNIYLAGMVLIIGTILFFCAGVAFLVSNAWKTEWVTVDSIAGPDGYTYCLMHEMGAWQDPYTKLVRTKDPQDTEGYEELGLINEESSWLTVIRPVDVVQGPKRKLFLNSNQFVFWARAKHTPFVYDIQNNEFYKDPENNTMSPFVLVNDANAELYQPDVVRVLERVLNDRKSYVNQKEYIMDYLNDANALTKFGVDKYVPDWPTQEALNAGLTHPNKEVQKIAAWLLHIQQNGMDDSETSRQISELLQKK